MFERENKEILGQETADFLGGKKKNAEEELAGRQRV